MVSYILAVERFHFYLQVLSPDMAPGQGIGRLSLLLETCPDYLREPRQSGHGTIFPTEASHSMCLDNRAVDLLSPEHFWTLKKTHLQHTNRFHLPQPSRCKRTILLCWDAEDRHVEWRLHRSSRCDA